MDDSSSAVVKGCCTAMASCGGECQDQAAGDTGPGAATEAPPRRPQRKRFDEDMEKLCFTIKAKEEELRNLQSCLDAFHQSASSAAVGVSGGNPISSAATVWQQRDEVIGRRRAIDERLQAANKEIANKRDAVARIHSTLNYKSEDRINEAIKRLEYQLRVNNFKVNEEKRIVKEIDNLNRSRRNLKEYLDKKSELDSVMKKQQEMRNERDALFRAGTELTQKGEMLKRETKERKARADTLKKELDDLYAEKRQLAANYRQSFSKYQHYRAQLKKAAQKKEEFSEVDEVIETAPQEAFAEERHLCVTLLSYLQRFECNQVRSAMTPNLNPHDYLSLLEQPVSEGHTPVSPTGEVTLLRRKEESGDEDWCCPSARGTRARRNHTKKLRQQQKKKRIMHAPEVFEQFTRIELSAPSLLSEVPVAIEQLKAKKKFYDHLSQAGILHEIPDLPLYSLSSTNADAKNLVNTVEKENPPSEDSLPTVEEVQNSDGEKEQCEKEDKVKVAPITTNSVSVPKTLDLGPNTFSMHLMNGYENGLDDLDMGYSSENGYTKFEDKKRVVSLVQKIES